MTSSPTGKEYWDRLYQGEKYVYGTAPNRYLVQQVSLFQPGMKALLVGDGEGRNGVWLAMQGLLVVSTEYSFSAVEKAKRLASQCNVELTFECCDLRNWSWPQNEFDVVAAIYLHLGKKERRKIHRKMADCLKPGGFLVLEAFRRKRCCAGTADCGTDDCLFTTAALRGDFCDLEILELLEGTVALNEGAMHQGLAEIVRLLARKTPNDEAR
jgi:SAM-dependent methyltransferase